MSQIDEKLNRNAKELQDTTLKSLFDVDPNRAKKWTFEVADLYIDLSKNHINDQTKSLWHEWLESSQAKEKIAAIYSGENVNISENRPALHHTLRDDVSDAFIVNGIDVHKEVRETRAKLKALSQSVRQGTFKGYSGKAITDVVHIGIGGSELGPRLLCSAFSHQADGPKLHFLATTDPWQIQSLQKNLNPETTLLIIASKSFGTEETLNNATYMRQWLQNSGGKAADKQMIALTANVDKAVAFGLDESAILPFWDWVGGRFSLWSAISLPFILQNGYTAYEELLAGAHAMDEHFYQGGLADNAPAYLALMDAWYNHYFNINNRSVVLYAHALSPFPQYLQQLDMESLGKRANIKGNPLKKPSGIIIWGGTGTESQHAFFQLLHQGQRRCPLDFITVKETPRGFEDAAKTIHAHCIAQSEALMLGRTENDLLDIPEQERYQRTCEGNRSSNTIVLKELTPKCLGAAIALYEHKTTVQGILYNINAYDQWGVELGKILAKTTKAALSGENSSHDSSTQALINYLK